MSKKEKPDESFVGEIYASIDEARLDWIAKEIAVATAHAVKAAAFWMPDGLSDYKEQHLMGKVVEKLKNSI